MFYKDNDDNDSDLSTRSAYAVSCDDTLPSPDTQRDPSWLDNAGFLAAAAAGVGAAAAVVVVCVAIVFKFVY